MHAKATGGHGIGSPCKPPSRVQRVRSAIKDDGAAAAGIGAKSGASTARPRFGARTRMFEAGFGRRHGWRRPKCRLRRSVRPVGRDEGTREAGGLPGEKTFGVICQRERVFQKSLAPARRAGETPSRARSSRPAWQSHANQERGKVSALRQTTKKTAAQGLRFFYWLNLLAPDANKAHRP